MGYFQSEMWLFIGTSLRGICGGILATIGRMSLATISIMGR